MSANPFEGLPPGTEVDLGAMSQDQLLNLAARITLDDEIVADVVTQIRQATEEIEDENALLWKIVSIISEVGDFTIKLAL